MTESQDTWRFPIESGEAVVIDCDGRTVYGYLVDQTQAMVADVWLFNIGFDPDEPTWTSRDGAPFRNPKSYVQIPPLMECPDFGRFGARSVDGAAEITLDRVVIARLRVGSKPGWSSGASRPGPLALPLEPDLLTGPAQNADQPTRDL